MSADEQALLGGGSGGSKRFSMLGGSSPGGQNGVPGGLNMIALEVVSCRGLVAGDKGGTSDAFVTLELKKAGKD